jgi:hypothetical protein
LLKTCAKQGIRFWDYLGARLGVRGAADVPSLAREFAPLTQISWVECRCHISFVSEVCRYVAGGATGIALALSVRIKSAGAERPVGVAIADVDKGAGASLEHVVKIL